MEENRRLTGIWPPSQMRRSRVEKRHVAASLRYRGKQYGYGPLFFYKRR